MSSDISKFNWIPARSAAKMLGISRQRVYQLINEGKLAAAVLDGTYFVSRATVETRIIAQRNQQIRSKTAYQIWQEGISE